MKKILALLVLLSLLIITPACMAKDKTADITLFYANSDNSQILTETREVSYSQKETIHEAAMEALLEGPRTKNLKSTIPANTKLLNVDVKNQIATVNFSEGFSGFSGMMDESMAIISVVNTLTNLEGVEKVQIFVEGKELISPSGKPYGAISSYNISEINQSLSKETITLYFPDEQAMYVVPEERDVDKDKPLEELVLKELMKGPETPGLTKPTIPKGTRLLSVEVKGDTAYVDFSRELIDNHVGGSTGEMMTIVPIVNSLTELEGVTKVQFLVEGKKEHTLAGHVVFDKPFERSEDWIKK